VCIHSSTLAILVDTGSKSSPADPLLLLSLLILEARVLRRILYSCYPSFTLTCRILVLSTNLIACAFTAVVLTLGWRERECFYRAMFSSRSCRVLLPRHLLLAIMSCTFTARAILEVWNGIMTDSSSIVHKFPQVLKRIRGGNPSDVRVCSDS
jgi:hypothetical protein